MIVKEVVSKRGRKSDFSGLAHYITDAKCKDHRLGHVRITGCESASLQAAIEEVLATQCMNQRAKSDKTSHLIVSFRAGEEVDAKTLKAIEDRICEGLGYGGHQRISAVHHDTDNLHVHIAINKIHPQRLTIHEPYYSHRTLSELCALLEKEFELQADNHEPRRSNAAGRARDMEQHSGVESLLGWIQRECLQTMNKATSWTELHQVMNQHGLVMKARGNGLVIQAADGTTVKASSVARGLSRVALERRLGTFTASGEQPAHSALHAYTKQPLTLRTDTTQLYARYKAEQVECGVMRSQAMAAAKRKKDRAVAQAKRAAKLHRAMLKLGDGRAINKKLLYAVARSVLKNKLDAIHQDYAWERARLYAGFKQRSWADWLQNQAISGCEESLQALRARRLVQARRGNSLSGHPTNSSLSNSASPAGLKRPTNIHALPVDHITKQGTIIYRAPGPTVGRTGRKVDLKPGRHTDQWTEQRSEQRPEAIRDEGGRLSVSDGASRDTVRIALEMALQRFGPRIMVNGDQAFKRLVVRTAVQCGLRLQFVDPVLEQARLGPSMKASADVQSQVGSENPPAIESKYPNPKRSHPLDPPDQDLPVNPIPTLKGAQDEIKRNERRPADQSGLAGHGFNLGQRVRDGHGHGGSGRSTGRTASNPAGQLRSTCKPGIGPVGARPPAPLQYCMRNLSELGLVQHAQRGEVLLPGDVPDQLEQQKRQSDYPLRRDVHLSISDSKAQQKTPADPSAERTHVFRKLDIPKYSRGIEGYQWVIFMGMQLLDGVAHAHVKGRDKSQWVRLDARTEHLLQGLRPGEKVRLSAQGQHVTLGTGRHR